MLERSRALEDSNLEDSETLCEAPDIFNEETQECEHPPPHYNYTGNLYNFEFVSVLDYSLPSDYGTWVHNGHNNATGRYHYLEHHETEKERMAKVEKVVVWEVKKEGNVVGKMSGCKC